MVIPGLPFHHFRFLWAFPLESEVQTVMVKLFRCVFCVTYEKVQPVSPRVLSLVEKTPTINKKFLPPPKVGPKITVSIIAFRIAWTLDVKIVWFCCQVAVCVKKWHKMQFLCVVGFKSSTLTVNWLSSWFIHQQRKHSQVCVSFVDSIIYHDSRELSIFHPLFGLESQIMMLSQKKKKTIS